MTAYTVTGHPLNYANLGLPALDTEVLQITLGQAGVGTTVNLTLSAPDETIVVNQDILDT